MFRSILVPASGAMRHEAVFRTALAAARPVAGHMVLVMGGYSHSRMTEVVFGGVTRRILRWAGVPVLMAH